jgi:hypothetical protein
MDGALRTVKESDGSGGGEVMVHVEVAILVLVVVGFADTTHYRWA